MAEDEQETPNNEEQNDAQGQTQGEEQDQEQNEEYGDNQETNRGKGDVIITKINYFSIQLFYILFNFIG